MAGGKLKDINLYRIDRAIRIRLEFDNGYQIERAFPIGDARYSVINALHSMANQLEHAGGCTDPDN